MRFGRCWEAFAKVAVTGNLPAAGPLHDRGLGTYQSKWRTRYFGLGHPGRYRLQAEFEEAPDREGAWLIRFFVEQQQVDDLTKSLRPEEDDWEDFGQDKMSERILRARLLGVFDLPSDHRIEAVDFPRDE